MLVTGKITRWVGFCLLGGVILEPMKPGFVGPLVGKGMPTWYINRIHPSLSIDNTSNQCRWEVALHMCSSSLYFQSLSSILQRQRADAIQFTISKLAVLKASR